MLNALLLAAGLLAIERVGYDWAWRRPEQFRLQAARLGIHDPVRALELLFYVFKVLQIGVVAAWCLYFGRLYGWPSNLFGPAGLAAVLLLVVGQVLNVAVFLRLGRLGVFYGNRFGHHIPWRTGFPFALLRHPQYVGAALTVWGVCVLFRYPFPDWWLLPALQSVYYVIGAWLER